MKLVLINKKILVKPDEAEKVTPGGIHIPDTARDKSVLGTIVEAADDCEELEKGDRVMYGKYAGTKVEIEGEELIIMKEVDIFGYLSEDEEEE